MTCAKVSALFWWIWCMIHHIIDMIKIYKFIESDGQLRYQVISGVWRPHLEALAMFARASCQECGGLGEHSPAWCTLLTGSLNVRLLQPWKVMNLSFWGLQQLWLIQLWVRSLCVAMSSCRFWFPNNHHSSPSHLASSWGGAAIQ